MSPLVDVPISIAEGLDIVIISDYEVLIQFGTRSRPSELLRDDQLGGLLGEVMRRLLRGPKIFPELVDGLNAADCAEASALVEDLLQRGILVDAAKKPVEQYLRYTHTGEGSLSTLRVCLIGTGPIGVRMAQSLLQQGLGHLSLLDDRPPDDLWYQFLPLGFTGKRVRSGAVHAVLGERLRAMGHEGVVCLEGGFSLEALETATTETDLVVVALEQPALRLSHLVNRYCVRHEKPWLLLTIDGNFGLVGPLFVPVHTCCFNDYSTLADAATPNRSMADKYRRYNLDKKDRSFFPGLPCYVDIVAGYGSLAATHFLLRQSSFALGRVIAIDFDRMTIDVEDVLKLPRCPVCGPRKSLYQPPFSAQIVDHSGS